MIEISIVNRKTKEVKGKFTWNDIVIPTSAQQAEHDANNHGFFLVRLSKMMSGSLNLHTDILYNLEDLEHYPKEDQEAQDWIWLPMYMYYD